LIVDTRIGETKAVLRDIYRFMVKIREDSTIAKLSVFRSVFVCIRERTSFDSHPWLLILRGNSNSTYANTSVKKRDFAKSSRRDTATSAQL